MNIIKIFKRLLIVIHITLIGLSFNKNYVEAAQPIITNNNIPKMTYGRFLEYIDMG